MWKTLLTTCELVSKILLYTCIMEQQTTQPPQRAADLLKAQADRLIMLCYEQENGVNCHGYTPQPHQGPDYIRAKSAALKIAKKYKDFPLWDLLKSSY